MTVHPIVTILTLYT